MRQLTQEVAARAPKVRLKGMGGLTHEGICSEVADWNRFKNWRQVGSYAGLTFACRKNVPPEKYSSDS